MKFSYQSLNCFAGLPRSPASSAGSLAMIPSTGHCEGGKRPKQSHHTLEKIFSTVICCLIIPGIISIQTGCTKRNPQQDTLKEYRKMLERQKTTRAKEEQEALKKIPEMTSEGYERLGDQYVSQGNVATALIQYDKALRLDRGQTRILYKIALLFLENGQEEEAKREFQEILRIEPNHALSHEGMGRVYLKMGNSDEAEKSFLKATQLDSNLWQAHNFLGVIYDRRREFDAAIAQYKAAIALKPDRAMLFNNLGMSLFLKGEYEKAVRAFTEAMKIEASNGKISNNLALALCKLERYEEAFEAFKRGGDEASAYNNLGCIYSMQGKYKEAIRAFEKAIDLRPGFYVNAYENLKKAKAAANIP